jgi:hypothetical protein
MTVTTRAVPAFRKNFQDFLDFLRDEEVGAAALSPKRFSEVFSIDLQTLAAQAHVHRNTVESCPGLRELAALLARDAARDSGGFRSVGGRRPRAVLVPQRTPAALRLQDGRATGERGRTEDLLRYIESLEAGATG